MLGVPYEDRHQFYEWTNRMIGSEDPEYAVSRELAQNAAIEMYMYSTSWRSSVAPNRATIS